jgi:hypothetical protein
LWLDASDATTITEVGGSVSQWDDKSGNARNFTQAVAANQPTTGTRTKNGLNVIDFDGSNDRLAGGNILNVGTGGVTTFGVAKMDTSAATQGLWGKHGTAVGGRYSTFFSLTTNSMTALFNDTAIRSALSDPGASNRTDTFIYGQRVVRNSAMTLWRNGSIVATNSGLSGTTSYAPSSTWRIGSVSDPTTQVAAFFLDGYIAEIIVFMRDLSDTEIGLVTDYLNAKWSVY